MGGETQASDTEIPNEPESETTPVEQTEAQESSEGETAEVEPEPESAEPESAEPESAEPEPVEPEEEAPTSKVYTVESEEDAFASMVEKEETILVYPPGYLKHKRLQTWGHVLFGVGFGAAFVGAILTEVDPWGEGGSGTPPIGKIGFTTVGSGIGIMVTGMFLLGLSIPVRDIKPKKQRIVPTVGKTNGVQYEIYF